MGPAAIGLGIGTTLLGAYSAKRQSDAAKAQAQAMSQPTWTQLQPYGPSADILNEILGSLGGSYNTALPAFPEYPGINFLDYMDQFGAPGVNFSVPDIPGASRESRDILSQIMALMGEDPFVGPAEDVLNTIYAGPGAEFLRAQGYLVGGPLAGVARGDQLIDPFEGAVAAGMRREADRALKQDLAQIASAETSVGQVPGTDPTLAREARRENREALFDALARARSANYQGAANRQVQAGQSVASGLGSLAGLRSSELLSALGMAPALEQARFFGEGLAGDLSTNIDRLAQAAAISEGQLGLGKAGLELEAALGGSRNALQLLGLQQAENQFRTGFDLDRFNFDVASPFLRQQQALDLLLPINNLFGKRVSQGPQYHPGYTPNWLEGGLSGLLGGFKLASGLGLLGGGNRYSNFYNLYKNDPAALALSFMGV